MSNHERLNAAQVMNAAAVQTGLSSFGHLDFVDSLTHWLDALRHETELSETGVEILYQNTVRLLVNRLRLARDLEHHPQILEEDVSDPVIVVGLPRTGTTKLHRLLACHHGLRGLPFWQLFNPAPFDNAPSNQPDPRIAAAEQQLSVSRRLFPDFQAGHPSDTESVDEEVFMMEMSFDVLTYWRADLPSFQQWCRTRPRDNAYRDLQILLKYLQWQAGGKQGRSLVLKCPIHLGNLDMIHRYFPKATVVHCHRDPRVALASNARLHELMWQMSMAHVDPIRVGDEVLDFWSQALDDNLQQREVLGTALRIVDIPYRSLLENPLSLVSQVLQAHGMSLSPRDITALEAWEANHPQGHAGSFRYQQSAYGLSDERIERRLSAYMKRFYPQGDGHER